MQRLLAAAVAVSILAAGSATLAKDTPPLMALAPGAIDPLRILPPPPPGGSDTEKAELAELHRIQEQRSPARLARAQWDDAHEDWTLFVQVLGPRFDLKALPATAKLLAIVQNDQEIVADAAKAQFKRSRPWAVDRSLTGCPYKTNANPLTSYPSGHTTVAFSLGVVLADLAPHKAQAILARADDYGYSRMVCGLHFRSDTVASASLGTAIGLEMLREAKLQLLILAAREEIKAAGLDR